jgi:sugar phosphate permease
MKLGTKSHLISAYSALATVALGILAWDYVRRTPESEGTPVAKAKSKSAQPAEAKVSGTKLASR